MNPPGDVPTPSTPPKPDAVQPLAEGPPNLLAGAWPDRCYTQVHRPELHSYHPKGVAIGQALVLAGGGYLQLVHDKEGVEIACWLASLGLQAHVLVHRLPGQPCRYQARADARHEALCDPGAEPGDDPGRVWPFDIALHDGLLALDHLAATRPDLPLLHVGLSSGGHLAGVLACQPHAFNRRMGRGLLVAYAPLNANHRAHKAPAGKPDYPPPEKQAFYDAWPIGIGTQPHGLPPVPVFLACALHDSAVPVDHALNLIKAMQQAGGRVDAHVFADAPHGFALRALDGAQGQWPGLAANWVRERLEARSSHSIC